MTLETKTIAILTANGVNQDDISQIQRALIQKRNFPKIIGAGAKLITSWNETEWGHNFATNVSITEALGVDYDILVIPGGARAMTVLQSTAHTQRILNSFVAANKPVLFMNSAKELLTSSGLSETSGNFKFVDSLNDENTAEILEWFASAPVVDEDEIYSDKQAA